MTDQRSESAELTNRLLVKLRPSSALAAAEGRVHLRPLFDTGRPAGSFELDSDPQWYTAELPDGAATPWDLAHGRVADQLGIAESDVLYAEPDILQHNVYVDVNEEGAAGALAAGERCSANPQDRADGKAAGPDVFAWHLGDDYSQLGSARDSVSFSEPRTRIAHLDTGYYRSHETVPEKLVSQRERSFVEDDVDKNSAIDPDNQVPVIDNSGHGTGTIGILAGGKVAAQGGIYLGGAYAAEVLPVRISDRVVLIRTSALARGLDYAVNEACDVITLSMGGLPSRAWGEAVDRAYERGVCICAAAGNHVGVVPPHTLVYPARYDRVIAVCGAMADGRPYADLKGSALEGSFGPASAMRTAMAAYTPNIPWPRYGCDDAIRLDGQGTSAATPQVAAAAALWFEKYKNELPPNWRRVEAVRHALFSAALKIDKEHFGNGVLRARAALEVRPRFDLPQSKVSEGSFSLFRIITGLGLVEQPPREQMFNLELAQRWLLNPELQEIVPDPAAAAQLSSGKLKRFMSALIEDDKASMALRKHVAARYPVATGQSAPRTEKTKAVVPDVVKAFDALPNIENPPFRRVRVYAVDPSFSTRLDTAGINEVTLKIRWETVGAGSSAAAPAEAAQAADVAAAKQQPGPFGKYFAIDDVDATEASYGVVDLDDPRLLAQDGWAPSEGNPHFHQQMVYAVAMKTVEHFERALGRPVQWRPKTVDGKGVFTPRLQIRPHALRQANAYYSPEEVALLFGYFDASADDPGNLLPGSRVYSCLSHDIIAHETSHAVLDGMQRHLNEPSNKDMLALHEGFADIVALMQHFTIPELLEHEIGRSRGDIEAETVLGSLAVQFGYATGGRGALRNAIGHLDGKVWKRFEPDPADYEKALTPHARGAVLVAAVFDAFIAIYKSRTSDLIRLYTGGTGVLPNGAIHPDLVGRLADEATKAAAHVLSMSIRALDYLPPIDVTFFEYLRALVTADFDIVSHDHYNYRVAFVEAFRRRGIFPENLSYNPTEDTPRTLSVDTLRWRRPEQGGSSQKRWDDIKQQYGAVVSGLKDYADVCLYLNDRDKLFQVTQQKREDLKAQLTTAFQAVPEFAEELGMDPQDTFEVEEVRSGMHVGPLGRHVPQVVVSLTQSKQVKPQGEKPFTFRGGSTIVVDLTVPEVKYCIRKRINSDSRQARTASFVRYSESDPLRALFFSPSRREPFAALHLLGDDTT
ncbi:MAG TPA: S8 family serine peptidase [Propionibacteriaceae bacterium]|nr:S8 family serine peptidase [Propionibacteriaceae bacterium]